MNASYTQRIESARAYKCVREAETRGKEKLFLPPVWNQLIGLISKVYLASFSLSVRTFSAKKRRSYVKIPHPQEADINSRAFWRVSVNLSCADTRLAICFLPKQRESPLVWSDRTRCRGHVIFAFISGDSRGSVTRGRRLGSSQINTHGGRQEGSVHVRRSGDFDILSLTTSFSGPFWPSVFLPMQYCAKGS